jgi:hypothetical protein
VGPRKRVEEYIGEAVFENDCSVLRGVCLKSLHEMEAHISIDECMMMIHNQA